MFREMRRKKQQLSQQECRELLTELPRGVLSLLGEDGYPYGIPMDHWYCREDGKLYFHCAPAGHKLDAIRHCPKASYCVMDEGYRKEGEWALNIRSVIVFGKVRILQDRERKSAILRQLGNKYYPRPEDVEKLLCTAIDRVQVLELTPEHISGKLVNES